MGRIVFNLIIDLLICFCGFGLGYKKGLKDADSNQRNGRLCR